MSRQADSLVKYETPILVSKQFSKNSSKQDNSQKTSASSLNSGSTASSDQSKTEDYLNSILPPNEYEKNGQLWLQYVSPIPATRLDVVILQQELDKKLQER
jgi:dynein light intermediate chain